MCQRTAGRIVLLCTVVVGVEVACTTSGAVSADDFLKSPSAQAQAPVTTPLPITQIGEGTHLTIGVADPPFERCVNLRLLAKSLDDLNQADLADAALQMAEAERVLQRHHRCGITASDLSRLAARLAQKRGDAVTLARLAAAAERSGDKDLQARIQAGAKLAGPSRAADPGALISVEEATPAMFAALRQFRQAISRTELLNDAKGLESLKERIAHWIDLPRAQRAALEQAVDKARESMPTKQNGTEMLLTKLAASSRDWGISNTPLDPSTWDPSKWLSPPQTTPSTFDDPQGPQIIRFSIVNRTNYSVPFALGQSIYRLSPGQSNSYSTTVSSIRISQVGGSSMDYSLSNGGVYAFQVNPRTGKIQNVNLQSAISF